MNKTISIDKVEGGYIVSHVSPNEDDYTVIQYVFIDIYDVYRFLQKFFDDYEE